MNLQYFAKEDFDDFYGDITKYLFDNIKLVVTDTYDERKISESVELVGKDICGVISIQLAIVGLGNKTYGKVIFKGDEIDIKSFFDQKNIQYKQNFGSQLDPGTLTPRRLIRFFRFLIRDFIMKNNIPSYLYKKYCPINDPSFYSVIYPGFEHIANPETDSDNVTLLIRTYMILDKRQLVNTNITERVKRVLIARGFNSQFLNDIKV